MLIRINSEWFCPKEITARTLQLASTPARVWTVAETVLLIFGVPLGEFALQGLIEEGVIAFPKTCLCPEGAKKEQNSSYAFFIALRIWARARESLSLD